MNKKTIGFCVILTIIVCSSDNIKYTMILSAERPRVYYYNQQFVKFLNLTTHRVGRENPLYYTSLHLTAAVPIDNNASIHFYMYQYAGGHYSRSFIDLHFKLCDLITNDGFFGAPVRNILGSNVRCPMPPGDYHLDNMTAPQDSIPPVIPLTKMRIYGNVTHTHSATPIVSASMDLEVRHVKNNKKLGL